MAKDDDGPLKPKVMGPTRDFGFLPIPQRCRYDPERPARFTLALNILFGLGSTVTVALLYYCQPLLVVLAESFDVSYDEVARIPTLTQAGYGAGLLILTPLGDLVRRRPLVLALIIITTAFTVVLAAVDGLRAFEAFSFLAGMFTVTPQILIPLSADLAAPDRRAAAISITLSGLLLGLLFGRLVAGIIAEYASWRVVYWMAVGLQGGMAFLLWLVMPDWPAKSVGTDLTYFKILGTMAKYAVTEPILVQCCIISCSCSANFSGYWVTLAFLLTDYYHFSTIDIGLFALIGILGVCTAPFVGKAIDRLNPWVGTLIGLCILLLSTTIQLVGGGLSIASPIITTFLLDLGQQTQQVANSARILEIDPSARARLNAVYIIAIFVGQVIGSIFGSMMYTRYGWRAAAGLGTGFVSFNFLVLAIRGPHKGRTGWFEWGGNYSFRKRLLLHEEDEIEMDETGEEDTEYAKTE